MGSIFYQGTVTVAPTQQVALTDVLLHGSNGSRKELPGRAGQHIDAESPPPSSLADIVCPKERWNKFTEEDLKMVLYVGTISKLARSRRARRTVVSMPLAGSEARPLLVKLNFSLALGLDIVRARRRAQAAKEAAFVAAHAAAAAQAQEEAQAANQADANAEAQSQAEAQAQGPEKVEAAQALMPEALSAHPGPPARRTARPTLSLSPTRTRFFKTQDQAVRTFAPSFLHSLSRCIPIPSLRVP